jgi:hypothetical protein
MCMPVRTEGVLALSHKWDAKIGHERTSQQDREDHDLHQAVANHSSINVIVWKPVQILRCSLQWASD